MNSSRDSPDQVKEGYSKLARLGREDVSIQPNSPSHSSLWVQKILYWGKQYDWPLKSGMGCQDLAGKPCQINRIVFPTKIWGKVRY